MMKKIGLVLVLVLPVLFSWEWYVYNQTVTVDYGKIAKFSFMLESNKRIKLPMNVSGNVGVLYPENIEVIGKKNVTLFVPTKNLVPGEYSFDVKIGDKKKTFYLKIKDASEYISVFSVYAKVTGLSGETIRIPLMITNKGDFVLNNARIIVSLNNYAFSTELFRVDPGTTKEISAKFRIPENLASGTYTILIELISPQLTKSIKIPLEVHDKYFVKNIEANISSIQEKNNTYYITMVIKNKNSISVKGLKLDITSGKETKHLLLSLLPLETKEYVVTVEKPEANIHVILYYEDEVILEKVINIKKQQTQAGLTGFFIFTKEQATSVLIGLGIIIVALVFYSLGKGRAESQTRSTSLDYIRHYIEESKREEKQ